MAFSVEMSLPSEFRWSASWLLRVAIPASVRCASCSTAACWLASASSCRVSAFRLPDSSISSDPCCSTTEGSPEVSTPATDVAPVSSNAAAAFCATLACAAWNWTSAWPRRTRTWDSLDCAAESCWLAWSSCSLTSSNCDVSWLIRAWTWSTVGWGAAPAPAAKTESPPTAMSPVAIATLRRNRNPPAPNRIRTGSATLLSRAPPDAEPATASHRHRDGDGVPGRPGT